LSTPCGLVPWAHAGSPHPFVLWVFPAVYISRTATWFATSPVTARPPCTRRRRLRQHGSCRARAAPVARRQPDTVHPPHEQHGGRESKHCRVAPAPHGRPQTRYSGPTTSAASRDYALPRSSDAARVRRLHHRRRAVPFSVMASAAIPTPHNLLWRKRGRKGCVSCLCSHLPGFPPRPPYILSQRCFPRAVSPRTSLLATASLRTGPPLPRKLVLARLSAHALTPSALPLLMERSARPIHRSLAGSQPPLAPPGRKPPRPSRATGRLHSPGLLRPPVQLHRTAAPAPPQRPRPPCVAMGAAATHSAVLGRRRLSHRPPGAALNERRARLRPCIRSVVQVSN